MARNQRTQQTAAHAIYRRLLALYPRPFRAQLGDSMQQTFADLYADRRRSAPRRIFAFLLWVFLETAIGIVREHFFSIKEANRMNTLLTSIRAPALFSFLVVLPLIALELFFVIAKRLTFDLRDALDSAVVFGILWLGIAAILLVLLPLAQAMRAGSSDQPAQASSRLADPTVAALLSLLLALPFVTILSLLVLNIEPPFAHLLDSPNPDQPNVIGTLIPLAALLLAVAACTVARAPILWTLRAGGSLLSHPIHLLLIVVIVSFFALLVAGLAVDQFPCWIGVPNCD